MPTLPSLFCNVSSFYLGPSIILLHCPSSFLMLFFVFSGIFRVLSFSFLNKELDGQCPVWILSWLGMFFCCICGIDSFWVSNPQLTVFSFQNNRHLLLFSGILYYGRKAICFEFFIVYSVFLRHFCIFSLTFKLENVSLFLGVAFSLIFLGSGWDSRSKD